MRRHELYNRPITLVFVRVSGNLDKEPIWGVTGTVQWVMVKRPVLAPGRLLLLVLLLGHNAPVPADTTVEQKAAAVTDAI